MQGWVYLQDTGLRPIFHGVGYSMLVSLYQQDSTDKVGNENLSDLKTVLAGWTCPPNPRDNG